MASAKLRQDGNGCFRSAQAPGLSPCVVFGRLQKACGLYREALQVSQTDDDAASAHKNIAAALVRMAQKRGYVDDTYTSDLREAVSHYGMAIQRGQAADATKSYDWIEATEEALSDLLEVTADTLRSISLGSAMAWHAKLSNSAPPCLMYRLCMRHAEFAYGQGVTALSDGDFRVGLACVAEALQPVEAIIAKGRRLSQLEGLDCAEEAADLKLDIFHTQCSCQSIQARRTADNALWGPEAACDDDPFHLDIQLDEENAWEVIDLYKQATILTREHNLEQEAIALGRLGFVYRNVLFDDKHAKSYYKLALQLAQSMQPRVMLHTERWYQDILTAIREMQDEAVRRDQMEEAAERAAVLKGLEKELAAIKAAAEAGSHKLIPHIYKEHPPRNPAHVQPTELSGDDLKKSLLTSISHYHPDKQFAQAADKPWCVLCEEITKALNLKYGIFKGMP